MIVGVQAALVAPGIVLGIVAAGLYGLLALPLVLTYRVSRTVGFVQGGIAVFAMFFYWWLTGAGNGFGVERVGRNPRDGAGRMMLAATHLSSGYPGLPVLFDVSFDVAAGELVSILGGNGAGKSTLLKTILGDLRATSGEITFEGKRLTSASLHQRTAAGISYCPEGRRIFPNLTTQENFVAGSFGIRSRELAARLDAVYELFPCSASGERSRPGRSRAANSRCWPSAGADAPAPSPHGRGAVAGPGAGRRQPALRDTPDIVRAGPRRPRHRTVLTLRGTVFRPLDRPRTGNRRRRRLTKGTKLISGGAGRDSCGKTATPGKTADHRIRRPLGLALSRLSTIARPDRK